MHDSDIAFSDQLKEIDHEAHATRELRAELEAERDSVKSLHLSLDDYKAIRANLKNDIATKAVTILRLESEVSSLKEAQRYDREGLENYNRTVVAQDAEIRNLRAMLETAQNEASEFSRHAEHLELLAGLTATIQWEGLSGGKEVPVSRAVTMTLPGHMDAYDIANALGDFLNDVLPEYAANNEGDPKITILVGSDPASTL